MSLKFDNSGEFHHIEPNVFLPPTIRFNIHLFVGMPHSASSMSIDECLSYEGPDHWLPIIHLAEYVVSPSLLFLSPPPLTSRPSARHTSSVEIIFRHSLAEQVSISKTMQPT